MALLRYVVFCGAGAALASVAATAALGKAEGQSPLRPINASSHWIWGEASGQRTRADLSHTAVGAATNIGAGLLWGAVFGALVHRRRSSNVDTVRDGMAVGALAAALDYGILPRRLTPGWELALSGRSVVLAMAAMTMGLVAGGLAAQAVDGDAVTARGDRSNAVRA
jgi:hypothetical protein